MQDLPAYIDPGSGSLIVQALIATAVAVPFFLRHQIGRVVRAIRGDRSDTPPTTSPDSKA
jgi:hypothetical protein